ncbi:unnamed protein product [Trifolium pratense]|uniref:Uncharacterized protein n=1 Tax=Trifolium pratense TaxID=57577 RepID=A0ACB0KBK9_TRIPR|nr:unnamed protein product [Trifolium pratense]
MTMISFVNDIPYTSSSFVISFILLEFNLSCARHARFHFQLLDCRNELWSERYRVCSIAANFRVKSLGSKALEVPKKMLV